MGFVGSRGGATVCTKEDQYVCDGGGGLGLLHGVDNEEGRLLDWRLQHPLKWCLEMGSAFEIITLTRDGC